MRLLSIIFCFLIAFLLWTCQNIEDASPSKRHTFIHLHEGPYNITANDFEIIDGGYVVIGTMTQPTDSTDRYIAVVFKTDSYGNRIGDFVRFNDYSPRSIIHHPSGGYIIVGDSIKTDLTPNFVVDATISSARIMVLGEALDSLYSYTYKDTSDSLFTDYFAQSVTIDNNGDVIVLGSFTKVNIPTVGQPFNEPEKPILTSFTKSGNSLLLNWVKDDFELLNRNNKNAKSVHTTSNGIIWAAGITQSIGEATFSYTEIPVVAQNSVHLNASTIGQFQNQIFTPNDIQPASSAAFGYGVVGTYSEPNATDGSKSNIFFLRTNTAGTIDENSVLFFDASLGLLTDNTQSAIIDEGQALASTSDGGFIISGTMETTPTLGNGGKDVILIKVDINNNVVWSKVIGGIGDEDVSTIKETTDNGLLICGTNTIGSFSVAFLIKTDKNGELKN